MSYSFLSGAIMMSCFVIGLFFVKFWQKSRDQLFLYFATSFWLLTLERIVLGSLGNLHEISPVIYLIRLCAFVVLLIGIVRKNSEAES